MSSGYDRAAAARYWGEERLAKGDELAVVLSLGEPRTVNEAYDRWERTLIERALAPLSRRQVIDLGCGTGRVTGFLAARGARVVAIDNAPEMLARCRAHPSSMPSADGASPSLVQAEAGRLSLRTGTMDAAVCVGLLEHLPADIRRRALGELVRVVRPEGRLALVANNAGSELLRRPEDNPHRKGVQYDNGYFCELVGADEVISTLESLGWKARIAGANPFYALLRFRRHAEPPLALDVDSLRRAYDTAVELDLATDGTAEPDRRWADHFFIVAEHA
jgi:SAM-dependent methyltransferase